MVYRGLELLGFIRHYDDKHAVVVDWERVKAHAAQQQAALAKRQAYLTLGSLLNVVLQAPPFNLSFVADVQFLQWKPPAARN